MQSISILEKYLNCKVLWHMKTRSMKLHCDNLQEHNDFSKSAQLCGLQVIPMGICQCEFIHNSSSNSKAIPRAVWVWSQGLPENWQEEGNWIGWILFARGGFHKHTQVNKICTHSCLILCSSLVLKFLVKWVTFKITRHWHISLDVHKKSITLTSF